MNSVAHRVCNFAISLPLSQILPTTMPECCRWGDICGGSQTFLEGVMLKCSLAYYASCADKVECNFVIARHFCHQCSPSSYHESQIGP